MRACARARPPSPSLALSGPRPRVHAAWGGKEEEGGWGKKNTSSCAGYWTLLLFRLLARFARWLACDASEGHTQARRGSCTRRLAPPSYMCVSWLKKKSDLPPSTGTA